MVFVSQSGNFLVERHLHACDSSDSTAAYGNVLDLQFNSIVTFDHNPSDLSASSVPLQAMLAPYLPSSSLPLFSTKSEPERSGIPASSFLPFNLGLLGPDLGGLPMQVRSTTAWFCKGFSQIKS